MDLVFIGYPSGQKPPVMMVFSAQVFHHLVLLCIAPVVIIGSTWLGAQGPAKMCLPASISS